MSRIPYLASPGLTVRKARPKSSPKHRGPLLLARSDEEDSIHNATINASLPTTSHRRGFSEFGRKMIQTTQADSEEAPRCSTPFPSAFGSTNEYDIQVARSMAKNASGPIVSRESECEASEGDHDKQDSHANNKRESRMLARHYNKLRNTLSFKPKTRYQQYQQDASLRKVDGTKECLSCNKPQAIDNADADSCHVSPGSARKARSKDALPNTQRNSDIRRHTGLPIPGTRSRSNTMSEGGSPGRGATNGSFVSSPKVRTQDRQGFALRRQAIYADPKLRIGCEPDESRQRPSVACRDTAIVIPDSTCAPGQNSENQEAKNAGPILIKGTGSRILLRPRTVLGDLDLNIPARTPSPQHTYVPMRTGHMVLPSALPLRIKKSVHASDSLDAVVRAGLIAASDLRKNCQTQFDDASEVKHITYPPSALELLQEVDRAIKEWTPGALQCR
ncbi:hypothetical protein AcV5_000474 [Taiwanofungus camphoratus]|nr:hypothetical protein AcV5_000474 [Antrodia cinnamomea]